MEVYRLISNCPAFPDRTPGIQIAAATNRFQEASWLSEQKFATLDELVAQGFNPKQEKNTRYSMEIVGNAVFSQDYVTVTYSDLCTRKKAPLLSAVFMRENTPTYTYVSAIFATPDTQDKVKKIICVGNTPGWKKLKRPYLKDGKPVCGDGTDEPPIVIQF